MALLVPALSRARKQARAVVCQAKLRQIGAGLAMSLEDHDGQLAIQGQGADFLFSAIFETETTFEDYPDLAMCPSASKLSSAEEILGTWLDPFAAHQTREGVLISYGLNYDMFSAWASRAVRNTHAEKRAFRMPAVMDSMGSFTLYASDGDPPAYHGAIDRHTKNYVCINRHETGFTNVLFLDFSVRKVGLKELWTLKWVPDYETAGPWTKAGGVLAGDWPEWMRQFKDY
jgi:prepilin-type processing-associated H-X9-DG protein